MIKSALNNPIRHNHLTQRRLPDGTQSTQDQMRDFVSVKYSKPYHSQLHAHQFELLCIDDDPVFQVVNFDSPASIHIFLNISLLFRLF